MSNVEVRPLDVHDDAEFAAAYSAYERGERHGRDHATVMGSETLRAGLLRPTALFVRFAWAAWRGAQVVGLAELVWPLSDNTHLCFGLVTVAPEHRRAGAGGALLDRLEQAVRASGRRSVVFEVSYPPSVDGWPAVEFARRRGYVMALHEQHEVLELPVPDERLQLRLATGYRLVSWRDRCPDQRAEAYCRLMNGFHDQAPTGDLDTEPTNWTVPLLREIEENRAVQGRHDYVSAAVSSDGELVGYTELAARADDLDLRQGETLLQPEHRGHGLGLAIKAANLRAVQADLPDRRAVHTYTSPENAHMVAVNRALGFAPVECCDEWQRALPEVDG